MGMSPSSDSGSSVRAGEAVPASSPLTRRVLKVNVFMSPATAAIKDGERRGAGDDSEACGEHLANTGSR